MNLIKRAKAPVPKFFRVLRTIGLALAAVGGTLLAAPVALPLAITTTAGYLAVAGGVISAVSQLTTESPVTQISEGGTELDSEEGQKNIRDGD
ncbi:hypothetical protein [Flavobacterium sp. TSSA_36]|uniref:hypothetical protein n=1 Tax=Flavobacterium sp. TSSA_36 TaxID=3447669 RepID=UPI003F38C3AB